LKYTLLQVVTLAVVVFASVAAGYLPVRHYWGSLGVTSLLVSAVICYLSAAAAAVPLGLAASYRQKWVPHAGFAGIFIRVVLTTAAGFAYYLAAEPDPIAFLICITGIYLILLLAESGLIAYIMFQVYGEKADRSK